MSSSQEPPGQANALAELEELLGITNLNSVSLPDPAMSQSPGQMERTLGNAAARQWAETQRAKSKPPQTQPDEHK